MSFILRASAFFSYALDRAGLRLNRTNSLGAGFGSVVTSIGSGSITANGFIESSLNASITAPKTSLFSVLPAFSRWVALRSFLRCWRKASEIFGADLLPIPILNAKLLLIQLNKVDVLAFTPVLDFSVPETLFTKATFIGV